MDLHFLIFVFPAGVFLCFKEMRDEHIFVIIYAIMASYFAGVMVRLMLTLTPVVCVTGAIAMSTLLDTYTDAAEPIEASDIADVDDAASVASAPSSAPSVTSSPTVSKKGGKKALQKAAASPVNTDYLTPSTSGETSKPIVIKTAKKSGIFGLDTRAAAVLNVLFILSVFVRHCTWVTSNAYSSPSVILSSKNQDGSMHILDDFREAYYWLRQNTAEDSVICSWWDYGYQIAGMADRPTLVDNNTWNNSK